MSFQLTLWMMGKIINFPGFVAYRSLLFQGRKLEGATMMNGIVLQKETALRIVQGSVDMLIIVSVAYESKLNI